MTTKARKTMQNPHYFRFKLLDAETGKPRIFKAKSRVIKAKRPVVLTLEAADVERSMALKGVGNTQTCSMAVCARRHADKFPHKVEGYIDWQYSRAYVVSKVGKNGLPSECYMYTHRDDIARVNDTKNGQKLLLDDLKSNGARIIKLLPARERPKQPSAKPIGTRDGSRTAKAAPRGAALRFAVAQLGIAD